MQLVISDDMRNAYKHLVGRRDSKTLFGRSGCRFKNNIKLNLGIMEFTGFNWLRIGISGGLL
jgi:hypothetical protein